MTWKGLWPRWALAGEESGRLGVVLVLLCSTTGWGISRLVSQRGPGRAVFVSAELLKDSVLNKDVTSLNCLLESELLMN